MKIPKPSSMHVIAMAPQSHALRRRAALMNGRLASPAENSEIGRSSPAAKSS